MVVEDWLYSGTDSRGELDLPLPKGDQWDDRGKTCFLSCFA